MCVTTPMMYDTGTSYDSAINRHASAPLFIELVRADFVCHPLLLVAVDHHFGEGTVPVSWMVPVITEHVSVRVHLQLAFGVAALIHFQPIGWVAAPVHAGVTALVRSLEV